MDAAWDGHRVVVEADITKFFDTVDHDRLLALVRERVIDRKILGWLAAILRAGICAGDELLSSDSGTPQGGDAPRTVRQATTRPTKCAPQHQTLAQSSGCTSVSGPTASRSMLAIRRS